MELLTIDRTRKILDFHFCPYKSINLDNRYYSVEKHVNSSFTNPIDLRMTSCSAKNTQIIGNPWIPTFSSKHEVIVINTCRNGNRTRPKWSTVSRRRKASPQVGRGGRDVTGSGLPTQLVPIARLWRPPVRVGIASTRLAYVIINTKILIAVGASFLTCLLRNSLINSFELVLN